ncbi:MAG: hypothetical protein GX620_11920 [Chloroflexi bacterium]|nr:hypothetical protein [Chloroflexota bacterium]
MTREEKASRVWWLILASAGGIVLVAIVVSLSPYGSLINRFVRALALFGYLNIFAATLSSMYLRQLVTYFGRPFVQVHHVMSVTGLVVIALHPVAFALQRGTVSVFVPDFGSWSSFFANGGRVAIYLIMLAAVAARLRKALGDWWRVVHMLNFVGFWLGAVHAFLIGTEFVSIPAKALLVVLAVITVAVFATNRIRRAKRRRPSRPAS